MTNEELDTVINKIISTVMQNESWRNPVSGILRSIYDRGRVEQWNMCKGCKQYPDLGEDCYYCMHKPQE